MGADVLKTISNLQAARMGRFDPSGDAMQGIRTEMLRGQATQDPSVRQNILQNPMLAKALGLSPQTMTPYVNAPTATAGSAISPLRAPSDALAATHRGLPPVVATDSSITRLLNAARATQLGAQANRILSLGSNPMTPPEGMIETGRSVDPITGRTSINYGQRQAVNLPAGAKVTPEIVGGKQVVRLPDPAVAAEAKKSAEERGKLVAAQREFGEPVLSQIDKMLAATDVLGSGLGTYLGEKTGLGSLSADAALSGVDLMGGGTTTRSPEELSKLSTLREGDQLVQQLFRLVAKGVATEKDVEPFKERLKGLQGMTQDGARNRLNEVRNFVVGRLYGGQDPQAVDTGTGLGAALGTGQSFPTQEAPAPTTGTTYDPAEVDAAKKRLGL